MLIKKEFLRYIGLLLEFSNSFHICWGNEHSSDIFSLPIAFTSTDSYVVFGNRTRSKGGQNEDVLIAMKQSSSTLSFLIAYTGNGGTTFSDMPFNYLCVGY